MSLNLENPMHLKTVWEIHWKQFGFSVIFSWINENIIAEVALYPSCKHNSCDDYT